MIVSRYIKKSLEEIAKTNPNWEYREYKECRLEYSHVCELRAKIIIRGSGNNFCQARKELLNLILKYGANAEMDAIWNQTFNPDYIPNKNNQQQLPCREVAYRYPSRARRFVSRIIAFLRVGKSLK